MSYCNTCFKNCNARVGISHKNAVRNDEFETNRKIMDKIRVRFNESDYAIYHNYCQRYYTILDEKRKRSIWLFLELFEKGILTVGEHDLAEAVQFFSQKCEQLLTDFHNNGVYNTPELPPNVQLCREIPLVFEDLEKIYRLVKKTGADPNYILILAMVSAVIDEEKKAYISAVTRNDLEIIELHAPAIAEVIRMRLGPDPGWETVLYELTRIVQKFNLSSPYEKINRTCISLLGPAVVAQFDMAADYDEVQAATDRIFEERELAEFESLINNPVDIAAGDTDPDPNDRSLFMALRSIVRRDALEGFFEEEGNNFSHSTNLPTVTSPAILPGDWSFPQFPAIASGTSTERFAISTSETEGSVVILPDYREYISIPDNPRQGLVSISLVLMGVITLVMFAITMAAVSGSFSNEDPASNMSSELTDIRSMLKDLQIKSVQPSGNNQSKFLSSPPAKTETTTQGKDAADIPGSSPSTNTGFTSADIHEHFFRILFGGGITSVKKPVNDRFSLAVTGNYNSKDLEEIQQFTEQFNRISTTKQFTPTVKLSDQADIVMFFLPGSSIDDIEPLGSTYISRDSTTGVTRFRHQTIKYPTITKEVVYINSDFRYEERTHWMLRALLYELGCGGETYDHPDSIFSAETDTTTRLSELDVQALELMYSKRITQGMTADRLKTSLVM